MKVLFLGPEDSPLVQYLSFTGEDVISTVHPLTQEFLDLHNPDFLISYNYWPIIKDWVLKRYSDKVINLHISFLPWNKGLNPNFWSHYENTPKGVTIHYVDQGIDTGDIIAQKKVQFSPDDTLATSYSKLHNEIQIIPGNIGGKVGNFGGKVSFKPFIIYIQLQVLTFFCICDMIYLLKSVIRRGEKLV